MATVVKNWRKAKTVEDAMDLIDRGVLLQREDVRAVSRLFSEDEQRTLIALFGKRFCERLDDRLACEIIVESLLLWLTESLNDKLVIALIDQIFSEPNHGQACRNLAEIALTSDLTVSENDEDLYAMAVVLTCELGIAIYDYQRNYPGEFAHSPEILAHINTYLQSVSNLNSFKIRLCLIHYFGYTSKHLADKAAFNRVINRFGHSVLDLLFSSLFSKKTEGIALLYILENLPFMLQTDNNSQRILHETMKYYMLKQPERFSLFLQVFTDHLVKPEHDGLIRTLYMQHLGALFKVVSEIYHIQLAKEILVALYKFQGETYLEQISRQIAKDASIRDGLKGLLKQISDSNVNDSLPATVAQFRPAKRGRRPSFSKANPLGMMELVTALGSIPAAKAS